MVNKPAGVFRLRAYLRHIAVCVPQKIKKFRKNNKKHLILLNSGATLQVPHHLGKPQVLPRTTLKQVRPKRFASAVRLIVVRNIIRYFSSATFYGVALFCCLFYVVTTK